MDFGKILLPTKDITLDYPLLEGFSVTLSYLSKEEIRKIQKKCTSTAFNKKTRQPEEEVNSELFQETYIKAILKGWEGFKYKYLRDMVPIDVNQISTEEYLEGEGFAGYSATNAVYLMKNASEFDNWVTSIMDDVTNFTQTS